MSPKERERYLPIPEARKVLPMSVPWFAERRKKGDGPPFVKIGARVFYPEMALIEWAAKQTAPGEAVAQ